MPDAGCIAGSGSAPRLHPHIATAISVTIDDFGSFMRFSSMMMS